MRYQANFIMESGIMFLHTFHTKCQEGCLSVTVQTHQTIPFIQSLNPAKLYSLYFSLVLVWFDCSPDQGRAYVLGGTVPV